jgi:alpha-tubulin suppressor-like RCC1 family protein
MFSPQNYSYAEHGFIYFSDGNLYSYGSNKYGQLGIGRDEQPEDPVFVMKMDEIRKIFCSDMNSLILTENGDVLVAGNNYGNKFMNIFSDENIIDIYMREFIIFLYEDRSCYTFIDDKLNKVDVGEKVTRILDGNILLTDKNIYMIDNSFIIRHINNRYLYIILD